MNLIQSAIFVTSNVNISPISIRLVLILYTFIFGQHLCLIMEDHIPNWVLHGIDYL